MDSLYTKHSIMKLLLFTLSLQILLGGCNSLHSPTEHANEDIKPNIISSTPEESDYEKIEVDLYYRLKNNPLSEELQQLISFYVSDIHNRENPYDYLQQKAFHL